MVLEDLYGGDVFGRYVVRRDAVAPLQGIQPLDVELIDRFLLVLDEAVHRYLYIRELTQDVGDDYIILPDEGADGVIDRVLLPPDLTGLHLYLP